MGIRARLGLLVTVGLVVGLTGGFAIAQSMPPEAVYGCVDENGLLSAPTRTGTCGKKQLVQLATYDQTLRYGYFPWGQDGGDALEGLQCIAEARAGGATEGTTPWEWSGETECTNEPEQVREEPLTLDPEQFPRGAVVRIQYSFGALGGCCEPMTVPAEVLRDGLETCARLYNLDKSEVVEDTLRCHTFDGASRSGAADVTLDLEFFRGGDRLILQFTTDWIDGEWADPELRALSTPAVYGAVSASIAGITW
jgi:hypothetical protein